LKFTNKGKVKTLVFSYRPEDRNSRRQEPESDSWKAKYSRREEFDSPAVARPEREFLKEREGGVMEDLGTFCLYFAGIGFIFSSVALIAAIVQGKRSEGKDF
jgi:hypothetical protein